MTLQKQINEKLESKLFLLDRTNERIKLYSSKGVVNTTLAELEELHRLKRKYERAVLFWTGIKKRFK